MGDGGTGDLHHPTEKGQLWFNKEYNMASPDQPGIINPPICYQSLQFVTSRDKSQASSGFWPYTTCLYKLAVFNDT